MTPRPLAPILLLTTAAILAACAATSARKSPDLPSSGADAPVGRSTSPLANKDSPLNNHSVTLLPVPDSAEYIAILCIFNSDPADLIRQIHTLFPVKAAWEPQNDHLILRGTPEALAPALDLALHLESTEARTELPQILALHLHHYLAANIAATLQSMLANGFFSHSDCPIVIVSDPRTNSVIIVTDKTWEDRFRSLVDELDSSPNPSTQPTPEIRIEHGELVPQTTPAD